MPAPLPDAEALLRRAIAADALDAVGPPALRLYYAGQRVAAYTALTGRKGHRLLDELHADPLFFAQDPRPIPGWILGHPRPFMGGMLRTRWSRIALIPNAPVQNLLTLDGEVMEVPLLPEQVRLRKAADLVVVAMLLLGLSALTAAFWGREVLVHNPYDAPIDVTIDGEVFRLASHQTARSTIRLRTTVEVNAQTTDGTEIDRATLSPGWHLDGYTLWNPGGRGIYFIESIVYGKGEPDESQLLTGQDVYEVAANWAFEPAPSVIRIDRGRSALRERLMCLFDEPPMGSADAAASLGELGLADLAPEMLRSELDVFPGNERAAEALAGWLTAEETVALYRELHERAPDAPWIQLRWQEADPDRSAVRAAADARRAASGKPINRLLWSAVDPDPASARRHAEECLAQLWADDPASALGWLVVADARSRSGDDDVGAVEAWGHVDHPDLTALARWEVTRLGQRIAAANMQNEATASPDEPREPAEAPTEGAEGAEGAETALVPAPAEPGEPAEFDIQREAAAVHADPTRLAAVLAAAPSAFYRATLHRVAGDPSAARLALNELAPTEYGWLYESVLIELGVGGSETRLTTLVADTNPTITAAQRRVLAAVARLVHAPTEREWATLADVVGDGGPTFAELLALDAAPADPGALVAWGSRYHADAALALSILARARGDAAARATWERAAVATADLSVLPHFAVAP